MGVHIMGILLHNKKITRLEGEGGRKWKEEYWPRTKEFNLIFPELENFCYRRSLSNAMARSASELRVLLLE